MTNVVTRLDAALLRSTFSPIAHWVDYRWGVNSYTLSSKIVEVSTGLIIGEQAFELVQLSHAWNAFMVPLTGLIVWQQHHRCHELRTLGRAYERNPTALPIEAMVYRMPTLALVRLCGLSLGLLTIPVALAGAEGFHSWINGSAYFACQMWFFVSNLAYYFAAVLPPTRKRRSAKAKAPAFGQALPAGGRA